MGEPRVSSAQVLSIALDVVETMMAATRGATQGDMSPRDAGVEAARSLLEGLDAETARRVAVAVADQWLTSSTVARDRERVSAWVERMRLEIQWVES